MIETIFSSLEGSYSAAEIDAETSFYFSIDTIKKTVVLSPEACRVEDGKTIEEVDCVCKTGSDFFLKIWNDGYRPGMSDFMGGKIKSNDPFKLKEFLSAFGK
jgi:putative sterol carrier protein